MKQYLNNKYAIIVFSCLMGLLLTSYVYSRVSTQVDNSSSVSININKTVTKVPVHIVDSSNSKYINNLPETVSVYLVGPKNILSQLSEQNLTVSTEDIAQLQNGEHSIVYVVTGLPTSVTATVIPSTTTIKISEKVTVTKNVSVNTENVQIATGYQMGEPVVTPNQVNISGSQDEIDKIYSVIASISSDDLNTQTFTKEKILPIVKDKNGNILDVHIENQVDVIVPIYQSGQQVPLEITLTNKKDGYRYNISKQNVNTLTLLGDSSVLNQVSKITATVNVENVTETKEVEAIVLVPVGVTISQQQKVLVTIEVSKEN